jgi:nucleoside 2-deoxyribosyltransferase
MSFPATVYNVMVGSPSDIAGALSVVREALARWNVMHSEEKGVVLLPLSWQTHSSPELGSPAQAVINRQLISRSDLLIAVFWTRLGTPTGEADSGTIDEILKHIEQGKPVVLYFCERDVPFNQLDQDQHAKLKEFRSKVEGLYDTFKTDEELREKVERHLNHKLRNDPYFTAAPANRSPIIEEPRKAEISEGAVVVLVEATKDPRGQLARIPAREGVIIATNHKQVLAQNARDSANNENIIRELENAGFIEDLGYRREVFQVTKAGFEYVDEYGPTLSPEPKQE